MILVFGSIFNVKCNHIIINHLVHCFKKINFTFCAELIQVFRFGCWTWLALPFNILCSIMFIVSIVDDCRNRMKNKISLFF